jgi:hypothetical protein
MSEQVLNQMIGWALVDRDFCHRLLANPAGVSTRFDLTPEERQILCDIRVNSLEQFAKELSRWIENNAPGNGHRRLDEISKMRILKEGVSALESPSHL